MRSIIGEAIEALDTPQLLIDLDIVDANLRACWTPAGIAGSMSARFQIAQVRRAGGAIFRARRADFPLAKLNEAEVLADAGVSDILLANEIVNPPARCSGWQTWLAGPVCASASIRPTTCGS